MMRDKFFVLLSAMLSAFGLLYRGIFNLREKKYGSWKREFAIRKVCYIEMIGFKRLLLEENKEKWTSVRKIEMFVISGVCSIDRLLYLP